MNVEKGMKSMVEVVVVVVVYDVTDVGESQGKASCRVNLKRTIMVNAGAVGTDFYRKSRGKADALLISLEAVRFRKRQPKDEVRDRSVGVGVDKRINAILRGTTVSQRAISSLCFSKKGLLVISLQTEGHALLRGKSFREPKIRGRRTTHIDIGI